MLELRVQEIVADLEKELAPLQRQLEQSLEIHSYAIVLTSTVVSSQCEVNINPSVHRRRN
jgi:hypothetical protein